MEIEKYAAYIISHKKEICKTINSEFFNYKKEITHEILNCLKKWLIANPKHYIWYYDGNPYDYSGAIREEGTISLNQTINDFLENEYSGNKTATFISNMGFQFNTFGDELSYKTLDIGGNIMSTVIKQVLVEEYNTNISNNDLFEIYNTNNCHDEIYDNCLAFDFFFYKNAINFCEIGEIKLYEVVSNTLGDTLCEKY